MKRLFLLLYLALSLLHADMFEKGNKNISASVGVGSAYDNTYTIAGVNGHYFIVDNLAVGLGYRGWFGSSPTMNELVVDGTYFFPLNRKFRPYLGVFARETFVSGDNDYQSYGGKAGLAVSMSPNSYMGFAYVIEYYSQCNNSGECSNSYPEVVFGLSF